MKQPSYEISAAEIARREDLRELPIVTIDGENARDFDDAVYALRKGQGYELFVSIADVAYYVYPETALDQEAYAPRHQRLFSRPGDPDAARSAVQRNMQLESQ